MASLKSVLASIDSIAIVGASPIEGKVGNVILKNILNFGFKGRIYPVNPKYDEIMGIKAWSNLKDLPEVPDIAVIAVPPKIAVSVIEDAAKIGVKLAIVVTAGFRELGNVELEDKLISIVRNTGIRVLGPNSAGMTLSKFNIHASIEVPPAKGSVGLAMQSGALGGVVISRLRRISSGISFFFSLGNMSDIDFNEVLDYALEDNNTESLIAYIEWLRNGREFMRLAREFTKRKPLCIIKGGWGVRSSEAVRSHTGGLATNYSIFKAMCKQVGAYLAEDLDELVEVCEVKRRVGKIYGGNVLVVTNSGGLGVITASHLEDIGLNLQPIPEDLKNKVIKAAGKNFSGRNPIDFGGDAFIDNIASAVSVKELRRYYDLIVLVYVPTAAESSESICKGLHKNLNIENLPIIAYFDGEGKDKVIRCASKYVPVVSSARNLASAIKELVK